MMTRRRVLFVMLVIGTIAGLVWLMSGVLPMSSMTWADWAILATFTTVLPWTVIGFWNATIGLLIDLFSRDPLSVVNRAAAQTPVDLPITESTALLLCVRNEMPARLVRNLDAMMRRLSQSAYYDKFHVYVLSDTTQADIARQEELAFGRLASAWKDKIGLTYRRREENKGFKAGNIEDFCDRWGSQHTFALVLDADSLMDASAIERLIRVMTANPQIGILQGLVVGLPSNSAFTRLFQFGMRLGMRSYTLGSAWWQGDCGPYWGHNAVLRIEPFMASCRLPVLTDRRGKTSHILSHDQVEAVLMRRAGYEVRVYPIEDQSWEENPPTLVEFLQRDLRWCAGNMQYVHLLSMPGLKFTSRVQLLLAILMFTGAPAWMLLIGLVVWRFGSDPWLIWTIDTSLASGLLFAVMTMMLLPQAASAISVLLRARARRSFGGAIRFVIGFVLQTLFSLMITPILWLSQTVFLLGLLFGKRITWAAQNREEHSLSWIDAIKAFGLHTVIGVALALPLLNYGVEGLLLSGLFIAGLWFAIPLAVITSLPSVGVWMQRWHLLCLPEEFAPPQFLQEISIAASLPDFLSAPSNPTLEGGS